MHVTNTEDVLKILFNVRLNAVVEFYPYKDVFINKRNRRSHHSVMGGALCFQRRDQ